MLSEESYLGFNELNDGRLCETDDRLRRGDDIPGHRDGVCETDLGRGWGGFQGGAAGRSID